MSDLVKRLRGLHVTRHPSRSIVECDETTILETAARIEQLEKFARRVADLFDGKALGTEARAALGEKP